MSLYLSLRSFIALSQLLTKFISSTRRNASSEDSLDFTRPVNWKESSMVPMDSLMSKYMMLDSGTPLFSSISLNWDMRVDLPQYLLPEITLTTSLFVLSW